MKQKQIIVRRAKNVTDIITIKKIQLIRVGFFHKGLKKFASCDIIYKLKIKMKNESEVKI